ncbi:hypothetical protein [Proteus mirabilis]|uniref:hypothetical protein n=1 Tax=Proteus mirabilis TaxID=584 RepID=UPI000760C12B|nr:hypothetical protein [Proteus mirabilis]MBG2761039.1 hypothetical protein [Proteus mirabilis]MBG6014004.1 hypothetical protein [Proteus mirabilis]MBI6473118.1 hypothetical protein [Proteus mirabilis]MBI6508655.1 hypothetical protein [Proteus mirabilis]MCE5371446.1 hypothetical protein [Proteus mirabilis]
MTVSTELSHEEYVGNGVTTDFDFRFRIFEGKHLIVVVADSDGNETILKNGTDYTIVGAGSYHGGKVVLNKPLARGWKILLERDLPVVQETDLRNQGKFFAEVHEDAFDYLTMLIQKALGTFSLSLRKPTYLSNYYDAKGNRIANLAPPKFGSDSANKDYVDNSIKYIDNNTLRVKDKAINALPNTEQRANKILAFDNNGQPITVLPESGSASDVLIELDKPTGAELINTNRGTSVQEHINGGMFTTRQLNITNSDQLVSALSEHGAIIVNSDVIIDKYTIIPSHSNVINGGGLFRLVNRDSCISIRPNVKFDCDVSIASGVNLLVSAFHIDGKIDNPRWYVADHDTYIKSNVRSDDIDGVCLFLDAISELGKRALISGLRADINLYRMKTGILAKTDGRKITSGNTYITSNTIKITASGTRTILDERYSMNNGNRPQNEEISGNTYWLEHQPSIDDEYKLINLDGRMNRLYCNLWDVEHAVNNDVIVINGDDNYITGQNLPTINSRYIKINGKRCSYFGHTYGIPEFKLNRVHSERGVKFGVNGDFKADGLVFVTQKQNNITLMNNIIFSKSIYIDESRRPFYFKLKSISKISDAVYKSEFNINNIEFRHELSVNTGHVDHVIYILISELQVHIVSTINGRVNSSSYDRILYGDINFSFLISSNINNAGFNMINILKGGTDNI